MNIDLYSSCLLDCIFCPSTWGYWFDSFSENLKTLISGISDKNESIFLGGREPLEWEQLEDLLLFIKRSIWNRIVLKTSWVIRRPDLLSKKVIDLIDVIEVPLYSIDTTVNNSICWSPLATLRRNLFLKRIIDLKACKKTFFHTILLEENLQEIHKILAFISLVFWVKKLRVIFPHSYSSKDDLKDRFVRRYGKIIENWLLELTWF